MRHAVLSDIHSNLEALDAVFAEIGSEMSVLCLGDIVGYGPNPNECVERIRERAAATVLGNHDVASVDNFGLQYFNPAAREAIAWTQGVLSAENIAWLDALSYEIRRPAYLMVHGAPVEYFAYVLDNAAARWAFSETDAPLILIGHTHIAEYYTLDMAGEIAHRHVQAGGKICLEEGKRYIVNVGSVGQPRDLNRDASYVIYDDEERTIEWKRVAYAVETVREKIEAAHLPTMLGERLLNGR